MAVLQEYNNSSYTLQDLELFMIKFRRWRKLEKMYQTLLQDILLIQVYYRALSSRSTPHGIKHGRRNLGRISSMSHPDFRV